MKERFSTVDLVAVIEYFNRKLLGMRAANIYDIDHKTYLIKLARSEEKIVLLFESGCRIHTTEFDWPKNMMPSGFAMKLRKHLRTKRLTAVNQLGVDRVVDLQFGSADHAHHLIIELYDRGNVILTDHAYTILSLLRVRTDTDTDVRFAIRETFSMETIKMTQPTPTNDMVQSILSTAKSGDQLKHVLNPHFVFGPALLAHCIIGKGLPENAKIGTHIDHSKADDVETVLAILRECSKVFDSLHSVPCKGYLIQRKESNPLQDKAIEQQETESAKELVTNVEFHPLLLRQHCSASCQTQYEELETFNKAVDVFFSSKTSQKQEMKVHQMQKAAVKKLENIQQDHQRRLQALKQSQEEDSYKAHLIETNIDLVERACLVIRSAIATSMDWGDIDLLVREAQSKHDPVALLIHGLKLESNQITLLLKDQTIEDEECDGQSLKKKKQKGVKVDIDLSLSAYANAQKFYSHKKSSAKKEQKTVESSKKALKSADKKAKQTLKEAAVVSRIQKARKVLWFEKFFWFISSENYLVIGGRDQQQNELIVKKYLNDTDLYVHADLHGATSAVIKNPKGGPVPPKTLNEAGVMAVCYSSAWDAKIITNSWWVYANQVSKTAPTGEYLTTGSFMIRGKKNYLPPCQLILGFSVMFKLDETCIAQHLNERRIKGVEDDLSSIASDVMSELAIEDDEDEVVVQDIEEGEEEVDQPDDTHSHHEESSSDDEGCGLPDTAIQIQSKGGISFELQRSTSNMSEASNTAQQLSEKFLQQYDGDNDKDQEFDIKPSHRHISAKERRMLKKKAGNKGEPDGEQFKDTSNNDYAGKKSKKKNNAAKEQSLQQQPQAGPYKRGQKSKQKKIKDKYWDQDEEERIMKMEILASSGTPKDTKGAKKGKGKGSKRGDIGQSFNPKDKYHQKSKQKTQPVFADKQHKQQGPQLIVETEEELDSEIVSEEHHNTTDIITPGSGNGSNVTSIDEAQSNNDASEERDSSDESLTTPISNQDDKTDILTTPISNRDDDTNIAGASSGPPLEDHVLQNKTAEDDDSDNEEKQALIAEENLLQLEEAEKNSLVIDSLTGSPLPDDLLLYSVPVCAPYSSLHDYKFKVKLVPGTNRRGKAAKTAVYKFIQMKETTQLEKDLLRSIKDNDLSRYFPGKVKMTIPQQILRTKH